MAQRRKALSLATTAGSGGDSEGGDSQEQELVRLENELLEANNQLNQYEVDCSLWQDRYEELLLEYRESAQQFDAANRHLEAQRMELERREAKLNRLRKDEILFKANQ